MKDCATCRCSKPLALRLNEYDRDEKLPFIESVLGALIESRFANSHVVGLDAFTHPRDVADACLDLHPQPFLIPLTRKFMKFLSETFSKRLGAAATGAASIPACQRLKTAYAPTLIQLGFSRGP